MANRHNTEVFPQTRVELDGHRLAFYDKLTGVERLGIELDTGVIEMLTLLVTSINAKNNSLTVKLPTDDGSASFIVANSNGNPVFSVDSKGAVTELTSITATSLETPTATHTIAETVGGDLRITVVANQDGIIKLGDINGANKLSITNSNDLEVASIVSTGVMNHRHPTVSSAWDGAAPTSANVDTATGLTAATAKVGEIYAISNTGGNGERGIVYSDGVGWVYIAGTVLVAP